MARRSRAPLRAALFLSPLIAGSLFASGCGGGSASPTTPGTTPSTPPTTTAPQPTPTPAPSATPYDCDRSSLEPGPVSTYRFKLKVIRRDGNFIEGPPEGDPFPTDDEGRIIVRVGDFIVFDSTQKNAAGLQCQWQNDPEWTVTGDVLGVRTEASRETTACGFLLRADVDRKGEFSVDAALDGIDGETVYGREPVLRLVAR